MDIIGPNIRSLCRYSGASCEGVMRHVVVYVMFLNNIIIISEFLVWPKSVVLR